MTKLAGRIGICMMIAALVWLGTLISDRQTLNEELIRFHVVANSDSPEDQNIKLQVRDAVIGSLQQDLSQLTDVDQARDYLQQNLPKIREIANSVLEKAGFDSRAVVTLCKETFDTRFYDTFALPAGIYDSLRITIGEGMGHNWWCVTFPSLCVPTNEEEFENTAAGAGFSDSLARTLSGEGEYEVRFFLLDQLGKLENIFFTE